MSEPQGQQSNLSAAPRLQRWTNRTELPLLILAIAFLGAYAWPILQPDLPTFWEHVCLSVQLLGWAAFAADYTVRLLLSPSRRQFVQHNLLDLAVIVLPMLRPLRTLRLLVLLKIFNRSATSNLRGRAATYITGGVLLLTFVAALAVLDAERDSAEANIRTFGDALWWAATTVATVGYGDHYPVTAEGRLVAVGLMVCGIALLGTVTATLASWFNERIRAEEAATNTLIQQVQQLREDVAESLNVHGR